MNFVKQFYSALIFASLLLSGLSAGLVSGEDAGIPEWAPKALVYHWKIRDRGELVIGQGGSARFLNQSGDLLQSAQISILSYEAAANRGVQFAYVCSFAITVNDTSFTVPGCYLLGEGGAPGLELYMVPSQLSLRLDRWYGLEGRRVLRMKGTQP